MREDKEVQKIIEYYDNRVSQYGPTGKSTLFDDNMRLLEIETVTSWLDSSDNVLDIFCGNGISTLEFGKHCKSIVGIDLSEKMIKAAHQLLSHRKSLQLNISFRNANVLDINKIYKTHSFNTIVSVRGLINLPSWELQKKAILNIHKMLPNEGKFIFIEGSKDGLREINKTREKLSLPILKEPWYDKYFEKSVFLKFMASYFDIYADRNFDAYFLISRVLYPFAALPNKPRFSHICNTVARLIVPYVNADINTTLLICKCFKKK